MFYDIPDTIAGLAERLIQDAMASGEFDDLAGEGKPLPGAGRPDDGMWWVRKWLERNRQPINDQSAS